MLLASLLHANVACAQQVALDTSACPGVPESEVRALLTLELHARLLAPSADEPEGTEHVHVRCSGDEAELTRQETGATRALSFSGVALALQARVLALAIAELLRPEEKPPAAPPVAPPAPSAHAEPLASVPAAAQPRFHLWAGVHGDALPLFALGGALLFRVSIVRLFAWSSSFDFSQVRTPIDRGTLRVQSISLRTGPALSFALTPVTLLVGVGARLSLLRLSGEAADKSQTHATSFDSWLIAPTLFAGAAIALARGAFLALELELGNALRHVRADVEGGGARTLSPWRASAVLGAGFQW